jgi:hypothetical protein
LVKYKREEKSDSETMGKIIYEKTMLINDWLTYYNIKKAWEIIFDENVKRN